MATGEASVFTPVTAIKCKWVCAKHIKCKWVCEVKGCYIMEGMG